MSYSQTRSASFTITDARYVGAKIGADLRMLNSLYGKPPLSDIPDYVEEAAMLLNDGYLNTVDFGFKSGDQWKLRLRYTATIGGQLADDRPGNYPTALAVSGLSFYSYLTYSPKFNLLRTDEQAAVKKALPVARVGAAEPTANSGATTAGHGYGRNGAGVSRTVYNAYE